MQQEPAKRMSRHAEARIRQRGIPPGAVELLWQFGEPVDDGYVLTDHAIEEACRRLRAQMTQLGKLRGVALIESDSIVVTVFRADSKRIRRLRSGKTRTAGRSINA